MRAAWASLSGLCPHPREARTHPSATSESLPNSRALRRFQSIATLICLLFSGACESGTDGLDTGSDAAGSDALPADVKLPSATMISVATFNVSRFFDMTCDTGECGKFDYEDHPTPSEFNAQTAQLVSAVKALDADIVLLQEVESAECLEALVEGLGDIYPHFEMGETGAWASLDVATLSKAEIIDVRRHRTYSIPLPDGEGWTKFARELLEIHIDWNGWRVIVFNAHFKAKVQDDPARRLAEAMKARELVDERSLEFPYALIVLAGDLNDVPGSAPMNELEIVGGLRRVAQDIPSGNDWTYNFSGSLQAIDHILHSKKAWGAYKNGTAKVYRDPGLSGWGGSDHGALRALFELHP